MALGTITSAWWIALAALLVGLLLVLLKVTLALIGQVKELTASARRTSEQLRDAVAEVQAEGRRASERMHGFGQGREGHR